MKRMLYTLLMVLVVLSISWAEIKKQGPVLSKEIVPNKPPAAIMVIQNVHQAPPVNPLGRHLLALSGNGFGINQGSREVRMGNYSLETAQWNVHQVGAYVSSDVSAGKRYPVCIWSTAANKAVSNQVDFLLRIMVRPPPPYQGAANSILVLDSGAQNIGQQGSRKVKFGPVEVQIVSWSAHSVSIRVPALGPGKYQGRIEDNGEVISYDFEFTIL